MKGTKKPFRGAAIVLALAAWLASAALVLYLLTSGGGLSGEHGTAPTDAELRALREPRSYEVPERAAMTLTVASLGIRHAPVFEGAGPIALNSGIGHEPETSMPWSDTPERNVYLAGHRLGWPLTRSRLIFYELDELERGDAVTLEGRGRAYEYRVLEKFVVEPEDTWVMGRVPGRDLLTLQTCTLPDLDGRLIVRAERL